ncbi:MAG: hemerythrin family protein [Planctomycetes bacterium]|nr:hemerythrin family protein [Planctomycetota bacterium]
MNAIVWTPVYAVSVGLLDSHHKKLFSLYNDALRSWNAGHRDPADVEKIIGKLMDYACMHFRAEEGFMLKYGYPEADYSAHKEKHLEFSSKCLKLTQTFMKEGEGVFGETINFVATWLINHILVEDKRYHYYFMYKQLEIKQD